MSSLFNYRVLLLLGTFCLQDARAASTDRYEELAGEADEFPAQERVWKEEPVELPALPGEDRWLPVRLDSLPDRQHAFIGLDSLSIGEKDQVVRYWFSIRSDGGGFLITHEGLHCGNRNFIIYAYGYPGKEPEVRPVRKPKWKGLFQQRFAAYRVELMKEVLCSGEVPRSLRQIEQAVKGRYEKMNPFDNWTNDD